MNISDCVFFPIFPHNVSSFVWHKIMHHCRLAQIHRCIISYHGSTLGEEVIKSSHLAQKWKKVSALPQFSILYIYIISLYTLIYNAHFWNAKSSRSFPKTGRKILDGLNILRMLVKLKYCIRPIRCTWSFCITNMVHLWLATIRLTSSIFRNYFKSSLSMNFTWYPLTKLTTSLTSPSWHFISLFVNCLSRYKCSRLQNQVSV